MTESDPKNSEQEVLTPVEARQGTGPRDMVAVLVVSTVVAAVATALLAYYFA